ncbi:MFS transporter [Bacillus sp. B15-48]|uniref:MFS transporter n=1 Tax=Bacillus sp. B15-48 TaxID=1548601 RepID=UPI00193FCEE8|nr:MFS transporter [Bacillus sp. B15-48]MBM4763815.1 MFS transporter [Bacillus sp. B15-48]
MNTSKPPLWTKNFILISLTCYFLVFIHFLTVSTVAIYSIEEFNASESIAGLASSIFFFGLIIARLLAGKYLNVIGRKKITYIGLSLTFLLSILYIPVTQLELFIFLRFLNGFLIGFALTTLQTAVIDIIPMERQGEGLSYFSINYILGTATGPFIGILIVQHGHMYGIFILSAIVAIISLILAFFTKIPEVKVTKEQLDMMKGFQLKNFIEGKALPIAILMGCIAFSYSSVTTFLSTYSVEIQLMSAASAFFIVFSVFNLISRPINGKLFDTKGANIVMYPSIVLFALGFFIIGLAQSGFVLLLGAAIMGVGYGNLHTSSLAIAIKRTPRYRAGLANSTFFIIVECGVGIGPFILGYLISTLGYRSMFLAIAGFVMCCLFLYYLVHGNKKESEQGISEDARASSVSR